MYSYLSIFVSNPNVLFIEAERLTVSEAAQHPFLAPELALKFLMSQPHGPGNTQTSQVKLFILGTNVVSN
jgi:hypothetical protein